MAQSFYIYYKGKPIKVDYDVILCNLPILIDVTSMEDERHYRKVYVEERKDENEDEYFIERRKKLNEYLEIISRR